MAPPPELLLSASFLRKLEALALVSRRQSGGRERGERKSSGAGSGVAFSTHRTYAAGDDFRFVDWKLFARSDRLYIKQYEEERDLSVHILLDCSASMAHAGGRKLDYAKQLAAALGYIALVNLDRVSVVPYSSQPAPRLAPLRGHNRALILLRYLSSLRADGSTDLRQAALSLRTHSRGGGLVLVISDGFDDDGLLAGVDLMRHARLDPVVLFVADAADAEPTLRGELSLVDSESGELLTLLVDEALQTRYRRAFREREDALQRALHERQVPWASLDIALPLERAVLQLLRRGGIVR